MTSPPLMSLAAITPLPRPWQYPESERVWRRRGMDTLMSSTLNAVVLLDSVIDVRIARTGMTVKFWHRALASRGLHSYYTDHVRAGVGVAKMKWHIDACLMSLSELAPLASAGKSDLLPALNTHMR